MGPKSITAYHVWAPKSIKVIEQKSEKALPSSSDRRNNYNAINTTGILSLLLKS